jgi:hypothetical protein
MSPYHRRATIRLAAPMILAAPGRGLRCSVLSGCAVQPTETTAGALRLLALLIVRGLHKRADPLPKGFLIVRVKQHHGIAYRVATKHPLV